MGVCSSPHIMWRKSLYPCFHCPILQNESNRVPCYSAQQSSPRWSKGCCFPLLLGVWSAAKPVLVLKERVFFDASALTTKWLSAVKKGSALGGHSDRKNANDQVHETFYLKISPPLSQGDCWLLRYV